MLEPRAVQAIHEVSRLQRDGRLQIIVGAGLSQAVGLPSWENLQQRLVELSSHPDHFVRFGITGLTSTDVGDALSNAIRDPLAKLQLVEGIGPRRFKRILRLALYGDTPDDAGEPNAAMLHLVALVGGMSATPDAELITLNYDDMLERAANRVYGPGLWHTRTRGDPWRRRGLGILHVHGYIPRSGAWERRDAVVTDRDYFAARIGGTDYSYRRLLAGVGENRVLMVGIGDADPNLYQALQAAGSAVTHYRLAARGPDSSRSAELAWQLRLSHWPRQGIATIPLHDWNLLPSFLVALRFESSAAAGRGLWEVGAERVNRLTGVSSHAELWSSGRRRLAAWLLRSWVETARERLDIPPSVTLEGGIFTPTGKGSYLDLPFRSDAESASHMRPGYRRLRADPLRPQGVAGAAVAAGTLISVSRDSSLWDLGFTPAMRRRWSGGASRRLHQVAAAPIFAWDGGHGEPVGVGYLASPDRSALDRTRLGEERWRELEETLIGGGMEQVLRYVSMATV